MLTTNSNFANFLHTVCSLCVLCTCHVLYQLSLKVPSKTAFEWIKMPGHRISCPQDPYKKINKIIKILPSKYFSFKGSRRLKPKANVAKHHNREEKIETKEELPTLREVMAGSVGADEIITRFSVLFCFPQILPQQWAPLENQTWRGAAHKPRGPQGQGQHECKKTNSRALKSHLSKNAILMYFTARKVIPPWLCIVSTSPMTQGRCSRRSREERREKTKWKRTENSRCSLWWSAARW